MRWTPDLIIAVVLIVGAMVLLLSGVDGEVKSILIMAAGWTFGRSYKGIRNNLNGGSK